MRVSESFLIKFIKRFLFWKMNFVEVQIGAKVLFTRCLGILNLSVEFKLHQILGSVLMRISIAVQRLFDN